MQEFFFNGIWRMDWGLGNPNKTASLIAILMVAVWALAYIRRWGFWPALAAFTGLAVCLVYTFSRGGLIGCFAGLLPVLWFAPRPWPWRRVAAVLLSVWIAIGFAIFLQAHERYGQGMIQEDRSITNRLTLWKAAPGMMKDAPGGWGLGTSGHAYNEWYQPLDQYEGYRTMVNSHLTWLVEFGWGGRFLYLLGWLGVFAVCLPGSQARWLSIPFGIWLSFFIGAIFSSVAESPWLWPVPVVSLFCALAWRWRRRIWPSWPVWLAAPVTAGALIVAAYLFFPASSLRKGPHGVVFGQGDPEVWVIVDRKVLGKQCGRALREKQSAFPNLAIGFAETVEQLPDARLKHIILTGTFHSDENLLNRLSNAQTVTLVNPMLYPQELPLPASQLKNWVVLFGEFSQSPTASSWAAVTGEGNFHHLPGIGDFIPNWPDQLLHHDRTSNYAKSATDSF